MACNLGMPLWCACGASFRGESRIRGQLIGHSSPLRGISSGSANFRVHLVLFPAAYFLSGEGFGVVAVVAWITAIDASSTLPQSARAARRAEANVLFIIK